MTPERFLSLINDALKAGGFKRHGKSWILAGTDVAWIFTVEKSPHSHRYSLLMGVDLYSRSGTQRPQNANYCSMRFSGESQAAFMGLDRYEFRHAFDLDFDLDDQTRESDVHRIMTAASTYASARLDTSALEQSYSANEFSSGFVHREARAMLEAGSTS